MISRDAYLFQRLRQIQIRGRGLDVSLIQLTAEKYAEMLRNESWSEVAIQRELKILASFKEDFQPVKKTEPKEVSLELQGYLEAEDRRQQRDPRERVEEADESNDLVDRELQRLMVHTDEED